MQCERTMESLECLYRVLIQGRKYNMVYW